MKYFDVQIRHHVVVLARRAALPAHVRGAARAPGRAAARRQLAPLPRARAGARRCTAHAQTQPILEDIPQVIPLLYLNTQNRNLH